MPPHPPTHTAPPSHHTHIHTHARYLQARALVTFLDAASEKTLRATVALTASRGRGKSASLGLAIAGALALGYSNIFVTAPSPDNTRTLFEFIFKGLDAMGYKVRAGGFGQGRQRVHLR